MHSLQKLSADLHPDTLLQIIQFLMTLIKSGCVLKKARDAKQIQVDLNKLFKV